MNFLPAVILILIPSLLQARQVTRETSELLALSKVAFDVSNEKENPIPRGKIQPDLKPPAVIITNEMHQAISVSYKTQVNDLPKENAMLPILKCHLASTATPSEVVAPPIKNNSAAVFPFVPIPTMVFNGVGVYKQFVERRKDHLPLKKNANPADYKQDGTCLLINSSDLKHSFVSDSPFLHSFYFSLPDDPLAMADTESKVAIKQPKFDLQAAGDQSHEREGLQQSMLGLLLSACFFEKHSLVTARHAFSLQQSKWPIQKSKIRQIPLDTSKKTDGSNQTDGNVLPVSSGTSSMSPVIKGRGGSINENNQDGNDPNKVCCNICGKVSVLNGEGVCQECKENGLDKDEASQETGQSDKKKRIDYKKNKDASENHHLIECLHCSEKPVDPNIVDAFIFCATDGRAKVVEDILEVHGVKLLLLSSSDEQGDTVLHAAYRNNRKAVVLVIKEYCAKQGYDYEQLKRIRNKAGEIPVELNTENMDSDQPISRLENTNIDTVFESIAVKPVRVCESKSEEETANILNKYKEHEYSYSHVNTGARGSVQCESLGKHDCVVHKSIYHGFARLPCCSTGERSFFICLNVIVGLAKNLLRVNSEKVLCPNCSKPIEILSLLKEAAEYIETEKEKVQNIRKDLFTCRGLLELDVEERRQRLQKAHNERCGIDLEIQDKETLIDFCNKVSLSLSDHLHVKHLFYKTVSAVGKKECIICLGNEECFIFSNTSCQHALCMPCMREYISAASGSSDSLSNGFTCPGEGCSWVIPDHVVEYMEGKQTLKKINRQLKQLTARNDKNMYMCMNPNCDWLTDVGCSTVSEVVCPLCKLEVCVKCLVAPFHKDLNCIAYQAALTPEGAEASFQAAKKRDPSKYQNCPICVAEIYKDGGCNQIFCNVCKNYFCWLCLKKTGKGYGHFQEGGECDLYRNRLLADNEHQTPEYDDQGVPACQRCYSENFETLLCGHYACGGCQSHMIDEIGEAEGGVFCMLCLTGVPRNRHRRPLPNLNPEAPNERASLSEATGFTATVDPNLRDFSIGHGQDSTCYDSVYADPYLHSPDKYNADFRECVVCTQLFQDETLDVCPSCLDLLK